jgi:hypothetical protein
MAKWKEGDRVRVIAREVTEEDRKSNRYYEHLAGLVGDVEYLYEGDVIGVKIDPATLSDVTKAVHKEASQRMREKFLSSIGEEQRKTLTAEELNFKVNYSVLVNAADLEKA